MKKSTVTIIVLLALVSWLGWEKFAGKEIDTAKLLQEVKDAQKTVEGLKTLFETCG